MNRLHESTKYDVALAPVSLASTNSIGQYYEFQKYREGLAVLTTAGIAETQTAILALFEATDELGTSSQAISGATITVYRRHLGQHGHGNPRVRGCG
jgi:hypothetical protein